MKKIHPFFSIGTIGMIVVACLHIFLSLGLSLSSAHSTFFGLYIIFLTFLILGFRLSLKIQDLDK